MKIRIDGKEIQITNPNNNIVEVADDNGITITAPCFRSKRKHGCCKACVIEIDGVQKYACGTRPRDGMNIVYARLDLSTLRKERIEKYVAAQIPRSASIRELRLSKTVRGGKIKRRNSSDSV